MPLNAYRACFLKMRPVLRPFIQPYMYINVLKIISEGPSRPFLTAYPFGKSELERSPLRD